MKCQVMARSAKRVDLWRRLLHVALAEVALSRSKRFRDVRARLLLADRDDRDALRAPSERCCARDSLDDIRADGP